MNDCQTVCQTDFDGAGGVVDVIAFLFLDCLDEAVVELDTGRGVTAVGEGLVALDFMEHRG